MNKGKYYAVPLHMHSCFEGHASMRGHMSHAKELGMEYMWITDHDFLMGKSINWVSGFSFADGRLEKAEDESTTEKKMQDMYNLFMPFGTTLDKEARAKMDEALIKNLRNVKSFQLKKSELNCTISIDKMPEHKKAMRIYAKAEEGNEWKKSKVEFVSTGSKVQHSYKCSLLSDLVIRFPLTIKSTLDKDVRICFYGRLSQQYPEFKEAGIRYVIGETVKAEDNLIAEVPVDFTNGGNIELRVSEDALKFVKGGLDNSLWQFWIEIELRNGKELEAYFGDFEVERIYECEEVAKRQRALAAEIGKEFGVTPIVTNEITAAGQHKISFSTKVPVIDYSDGPKDHDYAVAWVKKHGGIFALNHPFFDWKRVPVRNEDRAVIVENIAKHYIKHDLWGATMMEVGFPCSRHNFSHFEHLALWDKLSEAGKFISGYGSSDNHDNVLGWFEGNNFCAFLYSENPGEESFIEAMKCGDLYTGDPVQFKGELSFKTMDGANMGQVMEFGAEESEKTVCLNITGAPESAKLVWVINGVRQNEISTGATVQERLRVPMSRDINFVRAEMYAEDGRCIMLTNPIYFVKKGSVDIPAERKVICKEAK